MAMWNTSMALLIILVGMFPIHNSSFYLAVACSCTKLGYDFKWTRNTKLNAFIQSYTYYHAWYNNKYHPIGLACYCLWGLSCVRISSWHRSLFLLILKLTFSDEYLSWRSLSYQGNHWSKGVQTFVNNNIIAETRIPSNFLSTYLVLV